jgi:hypothetical protein
MGDDDRAAIANLRARVDTLERDISDIKAEQVRYRDRAEEAVLGQKDLATSIELLSRNIAEHLRLHEGNNVRKFRAIDVILALGMLLTSAISAYGAVAMIAVSKAVSK